MKTTRTIQENRPRERRKSKAQLEVGGLSPERITDRACAMTEVLKSILARGSENNISRYVELFR